ncbi:hypothetical protein [Cohnella sp. WQ 127256]|uniref:hypothetical protein n=1 Tax=Cohnella sp. WQ 127256 TaxID=2938790 RepID=UPI00211747D1|nr:hypothetical protein [Cohnella sp. WQ 127256]
MKRSIYTSIILITVLIISGCSSTRDLFIGNWSAIQVSQAEGTSEEIISYNYWEVKSNEILFSSFVQSIENGIENKKFDETNRKKYGYTWNSKNGILINQKIYKVEIEKREMTVSNDNMEIIFERVD